MSTAQSGIALKKTPIVLLVIVVMVAIGAALIFRAPPSKPKAPDYRKIGDQFMASITGQNTEAAYNSMTTDLQAQKSHDEWMAALRDTFSAYTSKAEFIEGSKAEDSENVYGESGAYYLKYRLRSADNTYVVHILINREGDSWKVGEFLNNTPFGNLP